jgi:chromosome segregation ATPase
VESKITLVKGLHEGTKLELEWLCMSQAEVLGAIKILDKFDILEEKRDNNNKDLEDAESELEVLKEQKKVVTEKMKELSENLEEICAKETACKERLTASKNESTSISKQSGIAHLKSVAF